jgi:hypothetical protein
MPLGVGLNINYPLVDVVRGATVNRQGQTFSIGGQPISLTYGCYADCVGAGIGVAIPGGLSGIEPVDVPEVRNADTTDNANGYITIVPIYADFTTGFNGNVPGHNQFRADVGKALGDLGY